MISTIKQARRSRQGACAFIKILLIAAVLLIFGAALSSCNEVQPAVSAGENASADGSGEIFTDPTQKISVGYAADDSLNPYFSATDLNRDALSLCYEPLFTVDDSFCAVGVLARSYTLEDSRLTVTLDSSAAFSDGVQFSSADAVYSFELAKASDMYAQELTGIASASASSADTVVFSLTDAKQNAAAALTFPIVKTGTAQQESSIALGTGLYSLSRTAEGVSFTYNPYCRQPEPNIKTISGVAVDGSSTLIHTLETGSIDAFFDDMSSGSYSLVSAQNASANLPNLVFIGMNSSSGQLSSASVRQAVYYAVNRQAIASDCFKKYAVPAFAPYHPQWYVFTQSGYDASALTLDLAKSKSLLSSQGVTGSVNMRLIVYSGNNFKVAMARSLKESLAQAGINATVSELSWDDYLAALESGAYELYIGEVKLSSDMDLSAIFSEDGPIYGMPASDASAAAYEEFEQGNISLAEFTDSFIRNMPFAPVVFRVGTLVYSKDISGVADCDYMNVFKNIYEWSVNAQ